jgi:large subunit ribosomal protein L43
MIKGVLQLERLTVRYCKSSGSSLGVRSLLLNDRLAAFAQQHPSLTLAVREAPMRAPLVSAQWADGSSKVIDLKNSSAVEVERVLRRLRDAASGARRRFGKPVTTTSGSPSVQGVWDPSITYEGFQLREAKQLSQQQQPPQQAQ